jgi:hypothetical protein
MKPSILTVSIATLGLSLGALSATAAVPSPATITAAKTPAEHEAIAKAYEEEAKALEKMAAKHKDLGQTYTQQAGGKAPQASQAKHCDSVAADLEAAAKEERALAEEHHKMAKSG